jgi:hypothetical protein
MQLLWTKCKHMQITCFLADHLVSVRSLDRLVE